MQLSKIGKWAIVAATVFSLTACGNMGRNDAARDTDNNQVEPYQSRPYQAERPRKLTDDANQSIQNQEATRNGTVSLSKEIADRLVSLDEVRSANVFLTDHRAYVAVVLDDEYTGDMMNRTSTTGRTGTMNRTGTMGQSGMMNGTGMMDRTGTTDRTGTMDRPEMNNGTTVAPNLMGDRNTGNGTANPMNQDGIGQQTDQMTDALKEKIARTVQISAPEIDRVYVSANPEIVERLNGFVDQVQDGHPVRGVVDEFNTMVERLFPEQMTRD